MGAGVVGGGGGWWRWSVGFFVAYGLGVGYFVVSGHSVGCFVVSGHGVGCFVFCGRGVGCFVVSGWEVVAPSRVTAAVTSRGLRRPVLSSPRACCSWCLMTTRRRGGDDFTGFVVRVELTLLRFNDELRGHLAESGVAYSKIYGSAADLRFVQSLWSQPDGDYRFVKRAARRRRPKVAFVAALP
uniref:DUF3778 domain-containing protein n=1 Tax=Oryza glumipatula TaxID=40148 RepID=A0A0E0A1T2_9ORYZ